MTNTNINKVIVAMPERLGDTLFHSQLFRLLKVINPNVQIDVIAPSQLCADVLQNNPHINKIFFHPDNKNQYDLAIDINDTKASSLAIRQIEKNPLTLLRTYNNHQHKAEQSLQFFAEQFGYSLANFPRYYELYPDENNFSKIKNLLQKHDINFTKDKLIGFHMGCHGLARKRTRLWKRLYHQKAWPVKNFIKLAKKLTQANNDIKFVLTGTEEEYKLANIFCKKIPNTINLINQTSVLDLAALMSFLTVYIANDTGSVHVACATKVPLIAMYLTHSPDFVGPYPKSPNRIVLDHSGSKKRLSVDEVLRVAKKFISPHPQPLSQRERGVLKKSH